MPPTDSNNDKPSVLKSTREAKGLTLEIVHEATKIPMDVLGPLKKAIPCVFCRLFIIADLSRFMRNF